MNIIRSQSALLARSLVEFSTHTPTRCFFWRSRPSSLRNQRKLPKELAVTFTVDQLFKDQKLNQEYISQMIAKSLRPHLPEEIKVKDHNKSRHSPKQTTVHTQPYTSNSNDFFLYYLLYTNILSNPHRYESQYTYSSRDIDEDRSNHSSGHSSEDRTSSYSSGSSESSYSDSSTSASSYTSSHDNSASSSSSYDSSSSSSDSGSSGGSDSSSSF